VEARRWGHPEYLMIHTAKCPDVKDGLPESKAGVEPDQRRICAERMDGVRAWARFEGFDPSALPVHQSCTKDREPRWPPQTRLDQYSSGP